MNEIANALIQSIVIVLLLLVTLLVFSILIEYVKVLWLRHKMKKIGRQIVKAFKLKKINVSNEDPEKLDELIGSIFEENGIDVNDEENEENE